MCSQTERRPVYPHLAGAGGVLLQNEFRYSTGPESGLYGRSAEARAFQICAERQEMEDVLFGKKIRNER